MDPLALVLHCAGSPKPAGASTDGAMQQDPTPVVAAESRHDEVPVSGVPPSQVSSDPEVVPSQLHLGKEIVLHAGGSSSSSVGGGQDKGKAVVVDDAAGTIQTVQGEVDDDRRFVMVQDVKTMLGTGRFEGQHVTYRNKRRKLNLLEGVIHGTYYFCTCGEDCAHNGKPLSARRFEQHAVMKGGKVSNNPNNHIMLSSSNVSLFEAFRKLKEARNEASLQSEINTILKSDHEAMRNQNVKTPADSVNLMDVVHNLKRVVDNLLPRLNTFEKKIDSMCKQMHGHQALLQELSMVLRKFSDDM